METTQEANVARIDIVSDAICPWCYIGKRHLESALEMLAAEGLNFSVHWNAFQLNPDMPPGGVGRIVTAATTVAHRITRAATA